VLRLVPARVVDDDLVDVEVTGVVELLVPHGAVVLELLVPHGAVVLELLVPHGAVVVLVDGVEVDR